MPPLMKTSISKRSVIVITCECGWQCVRSCLSVCLSVLLMQ